MNVGSYFERNYTDLPPHDLVAFSINFTLIDSWDSTDSLAIQVDEKDVARLYVTKGFGASFNATLCGNVTRKDAKDAILSGKTPHTGSKMKLRVMNYMDSVSVDESFGFRDVQLIFLNSSSESPTTTSWCSMTPNFTTVGTNMTTKCNCTVISPGICESCPANCSSCIGSTSSDCLECASGYSFYGDSCKCAGYEYYKNKSCLASCPSPLTTITLDGGLKFCYPPICGTDYCESCEKTSQCGEKRTCDTSIGGFCLLSIEYILSAQLLKPITNGYKTLVKVNLKDDLRPGLDDIIEVEIDGLEEGMDYKLTIEKQDIITFWVSFEVLRSVSLSMFHVKYTYSPSRLALTASLDLPSVTFISESAIKASDTIGSSSNAGSIILLVCIVGFLLLGSFSKILSFLAINQYIYHLLYLNVQYLLPVRTYFKGLSNYKMIFFQSKSDVSASYNEDELLNLIQGWPTRFIFEEYPASLVDSSGQILAMLFGTFGLLILTIFALRFFRLHFLVSLKSSLQWGLPIRNALIYSLSLTMTCFLQLHLAIFGITVSLPSLMISIVVLIFIVTFFANCGPLISKIPRHRIIKLSYTNLYGVLWDGLSQSDKFSKYFYLIICLRGLLLAYLCVFFALYPLAQIFICIGMQCGVLVFFFHRRGIRLVFSDVLLNRLSLLSEFILLGMKLLILGYHLVTVSEAPDDKVMMNLSWSIAACGICIQLIQALFALYIQWKNWRILVKRIRGIFLKVTNRTPKKKKKIKRTPRPRSRTPHSTLGC